MVSAAPASSTTILAKKVTNHGLSETPWYHDAIGRKQVADYLTPFLASIRQPFVVSVDAPYGGGKSYFLQNWRRDLDEVGYVTVYFNAWETDFSEDPLLAFLATISQQLETKKQSNPGGIKKTVLNKLTNDGPKLIAKASELVVKAFLRRHLGDNGLDAVKDILDEHSEEEVVREIGAAATRIFKQQNEDLDAMLNFRDELERSIQELTSGLPVDQQKLVVFVDELDRCRPNYAVDVLERIKHFFAVPGMVLILGIDEKQIANAMAAVYGPKLDTDGYLRRFIDWRFRLPKPADVEYTNFLSQQFFLSELHDVWREDEPAYNSLEILLRSMGVVSEALGLTLRQQEQNFTELNLMLRTLSAHSSPLSCVVGFLLPLRTANQSLYEAAYTPQLPGSVTLRETRELFEFTKVKLEKIDGLKRIGQWTKWDDLEGVFLAWFVTESIVNSIRANHEEAASMLNTDHERLLNGKSRADVEYSMNLWATCYGEFVKVQSKLVPDLGQSLANTVRDRLDNAGQYLVSPEC